ncbi:hypothetical protein LIA77_05575 [Sarocladium implicatum]|nr:hypothetical protein LIA77_05575 [Sarocladium implicatum]
MRSLSILIAFMAATSALAADLPDCPQTCIDDNPTSSFCDGDEKGLELDECTCQSYFGSLMIQCIQECPDSDQSAFKATLPKSCRDGVLPGVDVDEDADNASTTAGSESSATGASEEEPTETEETANDDTDGNDDDDGDDDDGAAGLAPPTLLAAAAVVVGLML